MRNIAGRPRNAGLARDMDALRRYAWLPLVSIGIALIVAMSLGALTPHRSEARFRMSVLVDAPAPLFGPAVLPSPFDFARLATSEPIVRDVAGQAGVSYETMKTRLSVEPHVQSPEIDFKVTGPNARGVAHSWQEAFVDASARQAPDLQRALVEPYTRQLAEARGQLDQQLAAANANPNDLLAKQQVIAAQENYETAAKLSQSYEVVARTMRAQALTVVGPHESNVAISSAASRFAVATSIGLVAGIIGALVLAYLSGRPTIGELREPIDALPALRRRTEI